MAIANADQLSGASAGSANAGLVGASSQVRSTEVRGAIRVRRFTFTIPASGAGSKNGDQIRCGGLKVTDRIYSGKVITNGLGAGVTLAAGKLDNNNSANNDNNHYLQPVSVANAGAADFNLNLTEQVGVDPTGAVTDTGDGIVASPGGGFGNAPVEIMLTIGGADPTAAQQIQGFIFYEGDEP